MCLVEEIRVLDQLHSGVSKTLLAVINESINILKGVFK